MAAFAGILGYLGETWKRRYFWLAMARLDLKMRYHGSMLGILWSLVHPLAATGIYCIIFGAIFKVDLRTYIPFLLSGMAAWNFISNSLTEGCNAIRTAEKFMRVYPAPIAIFGLRTVCSLSFHFFVILSITLIFSWVLQGFGNLSLLPALIPAVALLIVFAWSVVMIFGIVDVYFPDNKHMMQLGLQLLFYTVPVIYPPESLRGISIGWLIQYNPLSAFIFLIRNPIVDMQFSTPEVWAVAIGTTMILFTTACILIKRTERFLILHFEPLTGDGMIGIHLKDINLHFRVRKSGRVGLKEFFVRGLFRQKENPYIEIKALNNINLSILEGQRVGIIGHNGAGKSTLLRLMAGVYTPSSGEVNVEGKISSLMEIGQGIEPNASGWENMALRFYLQGVSPDEVQAKKQEIAEFSELGDLLQMPMRYYSAGMYVRLTFAIATAIDPEILLLDEVFGAGDMAFQEKARKRMLSLVDKARLLVFVSHDLNTMQELCTRVIWMDKGAVIHDGDAKEILDAYREKYKKPAKAKAA